MRSLLPTRLARTNGLLRLPALAGRSGAICDPPTCLKDCRCFARVHDVDGIGRDVWFSSAAPRQSLKQPDDHKPPDERTLQLGKTIRTLHERLPTLLQSPLPSEILSPQISLHLFPSTHPHLPTVSGRLAYVAALWTAPVAWGRVPLVGNVQLTILSERMVKNGGNTGPVTSREEKLIVKWETCGKTKHRDGTGGIYRGSEISAKDPMDRIKDFIAGASNKASNDEPQSEEFCGIFIFEFDEKGRILKHVIEHTEEGGHWDHLPRVVSVTDWLLGHLNGKGKQSVPELAMCEERSSNMDVELDSSARGSR